MPVAVTNVTDRKQNRTLLGESILQYNLYNQTLRYNNG